MNATLSPLGFRPLYQQVRDILVKNIADGFWKPGEALPSEIQLAKELQVSQGTVRKALDVMAEEHLVTRRQGRGTFVGVQNREQAGGLYNRLLPDDEDAGEVVTYEARVSEQAVDRLLADVLESEMGGTVWVINRRARAAGQIIRYEKIFVPKEKMPDLNEWRPFPDDLYSAYSSRHGVTVARIVEKLKAIKADATAAKQLDCSPGEAILKIFRQAIDLSGGIAEIRISNCLSQHHHYLSEM